MDALDILRVLRRRWRLAAAVLSVLLAMLGAVAFLVPQQHRTTAVSLVIPQNNADVQNPFGTVDRAQAQAASLLVTILNAPQTRDELETAGVVGAVEVTNGSGVLDTDSPFVTVTVTASDAAAAVRSAQLVRQRARDELKQRQDGVQVAENQRLILNDVLSPDATTTTRAAQLRAVGLVGALGLVLGVLVVVVVDRIQSRRAGTAAEDRGFAHPRDDEHGRPRPAAAPRPVVKPVPNPNRRGLAQPLSGRPAGANTVLGHGPPGKTNGMLVNDVGTGVRDFSGPGVLPGTSGAGVPRGMAAPADRPGVDIPQGIPSNSAPVKPTPLNVTPTKPDPVDSAAETTIIAGRFPFKPITSTLDGKRTKPARPIAGIGHSPARNKAVPTGFGYADPPTVRLSRFTLEESGPAAEKGR